MKTQTKKILAGVGLALLGNFASHAQTGLQGIVVEKYYQVTPADVAWAAANNLDANGDTVKLNPGTIVYRVYVDMASGWKYNLAFGSSANPWKITTTTNFYNDVNNGQAIGMQGVGLNNTRAGTTLIDSYLTTGGTMANKAGVLKTEDTDGAIANTSGILTNTLGGIFGVAINSLVTGSTGGTNARDGFAPSTTLTSQPPTVLGIGSLSDIFNATPGNQFLVNAGSVAALGGIVGTTTTNLVLIGQFATDGVFGFELNIQIQNISSSAVENYVAANPASGQFTHPALTLAPPTVTVTAPLNGANVITGSQVNITAGAADNGTVVSVEFKVDGVSVGTDLSSPYAASYTATTGSHTITAIATDNDALTATSSNVVISAAPNQAPVVSVVAPSGAKVGDVITFTASATDVDGTVTAGTFSVDNVLIGTVTVNGPTYTFTWTATLGAHNVRASATDNNGTVGISTQVAFSVVNNLPPVVGITTPTYNSIISGTTAVVVISANSSDPDGTVASVEFLVNNVSVGTVVTSPYTTTWTPTNFGTSNLTAKSTDNNGAITTSSIVVVNVQNPNALPYALGNIKDKCTQPGFSLPISAASTYTVDNVIGYDVVLHYDATRVVPTGSVTVLSGLINPSYVTVINSFASGTMNISAYFNGSAPGNAEFNGTGDLFNVDFLKINPNFGDVDTAVFSISSLDESYFTGVTPKSTSNGRFTTYKDTMYNGALRFWLDNSALAYNSANPNANLITNIYGTTPLCLTNTLYSPAQPNLSGNFVHNTLSGLSININRDILATTSVFQVIGANDVFIGRQILLNTVTLTPSVYQVVALDVNLDGVISSGDLGQINQRTVLSIPEFKQSWNYNAAGTNTLGQPSKDWTFIDSVRVTTDPAYQISSTYPLNDNIGFSKAKVPSTPFCLPIRVTNPLNCPILTAEVYKGVMIGDADGSFSSFSGTLQLRPSNDKIVIDLEKSIVNGNTVEVPLSFVSAVPVTGFNLEAKFDENLTYNNVVNYPSKSDAVAYLNPNDKTFRFTSTNVDLSAYSDQAPVASIRFETADGVIDANQFNSLIGLLNGVEVGVEVTGKTVGMNTLNSSNNSVSVYPNPTNGVLNVTSISDATVQLFDVTGKVVLLQTSVTASKTQEINVSNFVNGVYVVKIFNNDFSTIKKVVITK